MRGFRFLAASLMLAGLAACGGGGGSSSSSAPANTSTGTSTASQPTNVSSSIASSNAPNVQPVVVSQGMTGTYNLLTTSVTICAPGTSQCQTINNIQVDTGSVGLRVLSSALNQVTLPGVASSSGGVSGACGVFGSGVTWGTVRSADVKLAGETASNIPVQIIADSATPNEPTDCSDRGAPMQTASQLKLNGILGIGMFAKDCGSNCASTAEGGWYYDCQSGSACTSSTQPLTAQITNPVSAFASDNNGVMISLPPIPSDGVSTVTGGLVFGIGTQTNNGLGSATILPTRDEGTYITSSLNGTSNGYTFLDSGSNGLFFSDSSMTQCNSWYCQNATLPITLQSGTTQTATSLVVESESQLSQVQNYAFDNLAGPTSSIVDLGLPFFYGRNVFIAIDGRATPGGTGPFYAF